MDSNSTSLGHNYIEYTCNERSQYNTFLHRQFKTYKNIIIYFYGDHCPYCIQLKPYFIEKMKELQKNSRYYTNTLCIQINGSTNRDICNYERVKGYPTIVTYTNGVKNQVVVGMNIQDIDNCIFSSKHLV